MRRYAARTASLITFAAAVSAAVVTAIPGRLHLTADAHSMPDLATALSGFWFLLEWRVRPVFFRPGSRLTQLGEGERVTSDAAEKAKLEAITRGLRPDRGIAVPRPEYPRAVGD